MLSISDALALVEAASLTTFKNLSLFSLRTIPAAPEPGYLLLEDAIARGRRRSPKRTVAGRSPNSSLKTTRRCPSCFWTERSC